MPVVLKINATAGFLVGAFLLGGCSGGGGGPGGPGGGGGRPPVPVLTATAIEQPVRETIDLVGTLQPNERVAIQSELAGIVESLNFEEGQTVEAETLLAELDRATLEARLNQARTDLELATADYHRAKALFASKTIPQSEYDRTYSAWRLASAAIEIRQRELEDAFIHAPFEGILGVRRISPGQYVNTGDIITTLVDIDPIKVDFPVPERYVSQLSNGQSIEISVVAFPEETFHGQVYFIAPEVDPATRTVLVRARMANPDGRLKPGMFGQLDLLVNIRDNGIVIPESALFIRSDQNFVMVVGEENVVELRPVTLGVRLDGAVEVIKGLTAGEVVVTEGHQKLGPGSPVMIANADAPEANPA